MAETKTETKAPKAKAKATKAPAKKADATAEAAPPARGMCTADKCKQPLRAKGYCRKHFLAWRRGKLGVHHHYKVCSKEACRKKREFGGLCAEHAGKGQAEAAS